MYIYKRGGISSWNLDKHIIRIASVLGEYVLARSIGFDGVFLLRSTGEEFVNTFNIADGFVLIDIMVKVAVAGGTGSMYPLYSTYYSFFEAGCWVNRMQMSPRNSSA